jgi:cob(I)alamin adenosyltransferase
MGIVINRVYTGVGDRGTTRLAGGQEVDKTDQRIEAYGTVDELNATLGVVSETDGIDAAMLERIRRIQNELFDLGGELATLPEDLHPAQPLIGEDASARLEAEMDAANESLPTLRSFVLPGGGMLSARLHVARTVCRRAERRLVALHRTASQRSETLRYLNRLSDWLFVMGRVAVVQAQKSEVLWVPGASRSDPK